MQKKRADIAVASFACILLTGAAPASGETGTHTRRVRPLEDHVEHLVRNGVLRSPSLRGMVERLDRSDVVVYVGCAALPRPLAGDLTFLSATGGVRYVMVRLLCEGTSELQMGFLGHELQHAIEIADRPDVVDEPSLVRAYSEFGIRRPPGPTGSESFDSMEADLAGRRIWREVAVQTD